MAVCLKTGRARGIDLRAAVVIFVSGALFACGGGDGGVDIAGGQSPDPVVVDVPVAYVKRPLPVDAQGNPTPSDARQLITFDIGADLFLRDRASPSASVQNITGAETQGLGDVRDLDASFDGSRIIFAMRARFIEGADEEDQPTWNIWEYDIENRVLRRVIASDITAESGHDQAPHYLPDGRIVFTSTRQRHSKALLLDESKPQFSALDENFNEPSLVLHVMDSDGSNIRQISYNQSHDLDPVVLSSGQIVFSRWDNMGGRNSINMYRMNPDGTGLELLYGANSHDPGGIGASAQFVQPREMPDGRITAIFRPFTTADRGGEIVVIDTPDYIENTQPTVNNIGILSGPAQSGATINPIPVSGISPGGRFSAAYPLWDGTSRMLISWSQCRLLENAVLVPCTSDRLADPAAVPAPALYGIWIYDRVTDTQLPILTPEEGAMFTDIIAAEKRARPTVIYDKADTGELDPGLVAEGTGLLNIRSVYDIDGVDTAIPDIPTLADPAQTPAFLRPARFLRIVKAVSIPDDDVLDFRDSAFGRSVAQGMREIIGYVPVEPDGSVVVKVPADVPLAISVLDFGGRRLTPRHQNWLQVRPGEELKCQGCHDPLSGLSHGRTDAFTSVYPGATTTGMPFPNTDPAIFADFGETMAEARARISCATDCAAIMPLVDVVFEDVWTDEAAAQRPKDPSFSYRYGILDTPAPTTQDCINTWSPLCRIVVNYEQHIHPIWSVPRIILAGDGVTVLEDWTCTTCHGPVNGMGMAQVPASQLDLTDGQSDLAGHADHFKSYDELLVPDNEQGLDAGNELENVTIIIGFDPQTGAPITVTVSVLPSISTAGANSSPAFFSRFDFGGTHEGWLTDHELRLIAEWVDVGAQYFNNPFDAPIN
jgi:hypothetical protein